MAPPAAAVTSVASTGTGGVVWQVWPGHELHLRTPPRWRHRWTGRRQPEVLEDGPDRATLDEEREHHPATATAVALEHLLAEDAAQQLSPAGQTDRRELEPAAVGAAPVQWLRPGDHSSQ